MNFENILYCKSDSPAKIKSKASTCEWQLIQNITATNCGYKVLNDTEYFLQLESNHWLFSIKNETKLNIECGHESHEEKIANIGKLEISEGCEAVTAKHRLFTVKEITSSKRKVEHVQLHNISWPGKMNSIEFNVKLEKTIHDLENYDDKLFYHQLHHYGAIYAIVISIIIVVFYFYSKLELAPTP